MDDYNLLIGLALPLPKKKAKKLFQDDDLGDDDGDASANDEAKPGYLAYLSLNFITCINVNAIGNDTKCSISR
jgi:hypothetical protein